MEIDLTVVSSTAIGALAGSLVALGVSRADRQARAKISFDGILTRLLDALNGWVVAEAGMKYHERNPVAKQERLASERRVKGVLSEAIGASRNSAVTDALQSMLGAIESSGSRNDAKRLILAFSVSTAFADWRAGMLSSDQLLAKMSDLLPGNPSASG